MPNFVVNFLDDPKLYLPPGEDACLRPGGMWPQMIVLHTTVGGNSDQSDPGKVLPGYGQNKHGAQNVIANWRGDGRHAGAHLHVGRDGTVTQFADLLTEMTYHAGNVNARSIGIELEQHPPGLELYEGQLARCVAVCDWLTLRFSIQRQVPGHMALIHRLATGGADCVGVFGHCHQSTQRGPGDPGEMVLKFLRRAEYEPRAFSPYLVLNDDLKTWRDRQQDIGAHPDGVPGRETAAWLRKAGKPSGLWVARPGDPT